MIESFVVIRREFRDLGRATMDVDGTGDFRCGEEDGPGLVTETADEEGLCLFGAVVKKGWAEAKEFLEGVPITNLGSKRSVGKVGSKVIKEDSKEVDDGTPTAAKEVWEDAK
jgi:hypothetical protein